MGSHRRNRGYYHAPTRADPLECETLASLSRLYALRERGREGREGATTPTGVRIAVRAACASKH